MISTVTHQTTKTIHSNLRDRNDLWLLPAIGLKNSCLETKKKKNCSLKKSMCCLVSMLSSLCVVWPVYELLVCYLSSLCVVQSLCDPSVGLALLKLISMRIFEKSVTETVWEWTTWAVCFVKTSMSQLRGEFLSDLIFISCVDNHIFSFPVDT